MTILNKFNKKKIPKTKFRRNKSKKKILEKSENISENLKIKNR